MKMIMLAAAGLAVAAGLSAAPGGRAAPQIAAARGTWDTPGTRGTRGTAVVPQTARDAAVAPPAQPIGNAHLLPVAYDCAGWHRGQVKAATIALSCFGSVLVKITAWKYWTGRSARSAKATLGVDTCQPNCVSGKFRKYAATVVLYRVRSHDGAPYYSRLKLQYRHDGPRTYTYRWARYPGATIPVWVGGPSGHSSG